MDIANDLANEDEDSKEESTSVPQPAPKLFLNKNNEFLEKEISFFITSLRNVSRINFITLKMYRKQRKTG